ncbi:hypothetical protein TBC1_11156 [Lentimicrobium saccharophilum]|uniref:Uncharacterized protein n=1 Tax=Lentimicrobium saccharophilum TaxID=1678841 RepID=A0A0S7BNW7_9BACT|nr:hypothetical protein TBC1_11156 [Lentimicrobium saccharophilum]
MVRGDDCLLDGTPISDAIRKTDSGTKKNPFCYMSNCIHPYHLKRAPANEKNSGKSEMSRFIGIQANASRLRPVFLGDAVNR